MKLVEKLFLLLAVCVGAFGQVTAPTIPVGSGNFNNATLTNGQLSFGPGQISFNGWPPVTSNQIFALAPAAPSGTCSPAQVFTIAYSPAGNYSLYACINWAWVLVSSPTLSFTQEYETPNGTLGATNGTNRTFTLAYAPAPLPAAGPQVYLGGVKQRPGADYLIAGQTITFLTAPMVGMYVEVDYWR